MPLNSDVMFQRLASGITEAHDVVLTNGLALREIGNEPPSLRRGRSMLAAACLQSGVPDIGSGLHVAMERMTLPPSAWGLAPDLTPKSYREVVLIDPILRIPTNEAWQIAKLHPTEGDAREHVQFKRLMDALTKVHKEKAYTVLRGYLIRNPMVRRKDLNAFLLENGDLFDTEVIIGFYGQPSPDWIRQGAAACVCVHCNSPFMPTRGYLTARCANRACSATEIPTSRPISGDPSDYLVLHDELMLYWVAPGYDEIRLFDALTAASLDTSLYPRQDEVDISVGDFDTGIDVKAYSSPTLLAKVLASKGRQEPLGRYRLKIIAVPDRLCTDGYLDEARDSYVSFAGNQALNLEFLSITDTVAKVTA